MNNIISLLDKKCKFVLNKLPNTLSFTKTTEQSSHYDDLEKMSIETLLININKEDKTVPSAVEKAIPQIKESVEAIVSKLKKGGRLFYVGAGTSGRLGILDASECPPTFGVDEELVIGLIAGGDKAIKKAIENAEDNKSQGWLDLLDHQVSHKDFVVGIAASGTTPYVINTLVKCNENDIQTACITCNADSPITKVSKFPIEVVVGPEVVTGSSRMKAGTAQKLVLNMISTSCMIQLGRVKGNRMVDMKMTNTKLIQRGIQILISELKIDELEARKLLDKHLNVREAIDHYQNK